MRRVKKSRNGCARCKSKRVKCGEEKPNCARCSRLGIKCPGYTQSLRWVNKCETLDNQVEDSKESSSPDTSRSKEDDSQSKHAESLPSPKQPELTIESLLQTTLLDGVQDPSDSPLGGSNPGGLCDGLWDLQGDSSLPELAALCPQSPVSLPGSQCDLFDLGSSTEDPALFSSGLSRTHESSSASADFSPSAIVRSYPPAPPRPQNVNFMSIARPLNNPSWTLIEYYFKEVAALFSSYDSPMNPFRSTVSRLWGSSLAMCRTMQSMAAATLVNEFPQFGPLGLKMRDEAVGIITNEPMVDDKSLLALLMLGMTASWHQPEDLGVTFFNILRKHLNSSSNGGSGPLAKSNNNNYRFFEEALIYWEMLLSFVADNDALSLSGVGVSGMDESIALQRMPHPWTGIARDAQFTVQEVGRLVRCERKRVRARNFTSQDDITQAQIAIDRARELEERLLRLAHPTEAEIVSPGDDDTPVWHLLTIAEVFRCTGLMQLYRVFPDLLHRRLPVENNPNTQSPNPSFPESYPILDSTITGFTDLLKAAADDDPPTAPPNPAYNTWLTEFALTTLSRLKTIPQESRTRCQQPFLLVASSSELRLPRPAVEDGADLDVSAHAIEVSQSRKFILGRLASFMHVLPPKPIEVCLRLVGEVWRRMDAGESNVYWMDVMIEMGWETTMG